MILVAQWIFFMNCVNQGSSGGLVAPFRGVREVERRKDI
jgi:hypothetical protein